MKKRKRWMTVNQRRGRIEIGDWGLGIGKWEMENGDWEIHRRVRVVSSFGCHNLITNKLIN